MAWRLYDLDNSQWYNDEIYDSQEACMAAGAYYMRAARSEGETLALIAEPFDPAEAIEGPMEEEP